MITTGVTGGSWRASITPWGAIEPWDDARPLDWYVAADDRWHVPANEPTVRQARVDGTPVAETRVKVPGGDVVQRIYSVPDRGGLTVTEVENDSTMPVAIAFDRSDLLTERAVAEIPIEGIELPEGSFVLPLGHRATLRVGIAHGAAAPELLPADLPSARQVANGWLTLTERASRFVLPDGATGAGLVERVIAQRCEVALGNIPTAADDPAGFLLALDQLVRTGERPDPWLPELVEAVEVVGPTPGWLAERALVAADRVLLAAGEGRARRDVARIRASRDPSPRPGDEPAGVALVAWLETLAATEGALLPDGVPPAWLGQPIECHHVPTTVGSTVSYAVRWHGARPAVLWEQTGPTIALTAPTMAPGWSTREPTGETLWPTPPAAPAASFA